MPLRVPLRRAAGAGVAPALGLGLGGPAGAQDAAVAASSGWSFALTPYVWFTSLEGDIGAVPALPAVAVDADFGDLIENADFAFMLVAEARRGRVGILADLSYLALSAEGDTRGPLFGDAEVGTRSLFVTVSGAYQVMAGERLSLDVLAGARIWYVDAELDFGAGLLPAQTGQSDELWADPVVGLRWDARLGRGVFLAGGADIGGFGIASDLTWQVLGTLDYRFNDWFSARAGYRHLAVDYENDGFVWDVRLSGPIVGATFRF